MNLHLRELISSNIHLIIIALYAYVLLVHVKDNEYVTMIILTAATCLSICYLKKPLKEGLASTSCVKEGFDNPTDTDKAVDKPVGSDIVRSLPAKMGAYDGLCLQTGNKEYWMKQPDNISLIPNDALFSYLSSQGPEKTVFTDNSALHGPPVDGQEGSPKKMFMFANNRSSPNCCPSTFSTSTGCVCTTKQQRDFIASRGNQEL
jgi:hypothetical protein